jgi:F-type H+-transporting ATPase subunit epsilon
MAELQVSVLSPSRIVAKSSTDYLQVPSSSGYLGIMPGHTAYVTEIGVGELKLGSNDAYFVSGGYLDVNNDKVTVMVDVAERPSEIDRVRAESAQKRALDRLEKKVDIDIMRAQAALLRAQTRLELSSNRK